MAERQEEKLVDDASSVFTSAIDYCFKKITLNSGEQVWTKIREEELLRFVADFVSKAKLFEWITKKGHDNIIIGDELYEFLTLRKHVSGYDLYWGISPVEQTKKLVENQDDRKKVLLSKYGPECIPKIERYKSLKAKRGGLLQEVGIHYVTDSDFLDTSLPELILAKIDHPEKFNEIEDLTTEMKNMRNKMSRMFIESGMPEMFFYEPRVFLYLDDKHGNPALFSEIPEEKREIISEEAKTIKDALSSKWVEKFDETFCKELQSKLYRIYGKIKGLEEAVKGVLDKSTYVISCPVNKLKANYVKKNKFDSKSFREDFKIAIEETCKRYKIGNLHPELVRTWETDGFLDEISLRELKGKREEIHVLYKGGSIDFILPHGGSYDKLYEAMTAYNGALAWMFFGDQKSYTANIRDLCVRSPSFYNMVQEKMLERIRENIKR